MDIELRTCRTHGELAAALNAITHYIGSPATTVEDAERFAQWLEVERMHAAWEDGAVVAGAGAFSYRVSVPGGEVPAAGVTVVGVLPSHRRRGLLRAMMRAQLDDARARGEAIAYLWASE